jgi:hypothetical protein
MAQGVNLSVAGEYTSGNDLAGIPPGALNLAQNVESRYKNTLEPRRGFEGLENSSLSPVKIIRIINFAVLGVDRIVAITSDGHLYYYNPSLLPSNPWASVPGNFSSQLTPPNALNAKSRFIRAGQNLYYTTSDGVKTLSSGSAAETLRAGVPKGLNLEAQTNGDVTGFFDNNIVLSTTGDISSSGAIISNLADTTGIEVGQYVGGTGIPSSARVLSVTPEATVLIESADTTAGSVTLANLVSNAGLITGLNVSGQGIPDGAKIVTVSGSGPYSVDLDLPAFQTDSGVSITFSSPIYVTMDQNATSTLTGTPILFYSGSQVSYRMLFGRVDTDITGGTITRLGAPSAIAVCNNISATATNVTVMGTLPKNAENEITFVQLYRSEQTDNITISPLDQMNLVYERELVAQDFIDRVITITDDVPDSLKGIPLYTGADREGILQANNPPPSCWDMCTFRDFALYANATQPSTLKFTMVSVGSPSGVQVGDQITISGTFLGTSFSRVYTGDTTENYSTRKFQVVTSGTPSQNIADTTNSLIRVINFDEVLPVHAILLSASNDLPGQMILESDDPTTELFHITSSAHPDAFDPTLTNLDSEVNSLNNSVYVSKSGELEAVPATNLIRIGDTSSPILRVVPLRDYVIVLKTDGIYKIQGTTPNTLIVNAFDLTTKIIGADTAVALNSAVWCFSNQGVVSISDGGVDAKSIPIDDQLTRLVGNFSDNISNYGFSIGYEGDRKYILCLPNGNNPFSETQYVYNYITNSWTRWTRNIQYGFIHSLEGKLYISRADTLEKGVSKERRNARYTDYIDEAVVYQITSVAGKTLTLDSVSGIEIGDIISIRNTSVFSPIMDINVALNQVSVQSALGWVVGNADILKAYECKVTWKQVFGDNPALIRQFSEGLILFKNTIKNSGFNDAQMIFSTDFSPNVDFTPIQGTGQGLWGLFDWGSIPWGGPSVPQNIRFYVPQDKQLGSYLIPTFRIKQGYSDFKLQGLSITYFNVSGEVGL